MAFYIHSLREDPDGKSKGKGSYLDAFQTANYVLVVVASRKSPGHMDTMRIQYVPPELCMVNIVEYLLISKKRLSLQLGKYFSRTFCNNYI